MVYHNIQQENLKTVQLARFVSLAIYPRKSYIIYKGNLDVILAYLKNTPANTLKFAMKHLVTIDYCRFDDNSCRCVSEKSP